MNKSSPLTSVNIWAGVLGDYVVGPYILPDRRNIPHLLGTSAFQFVAGCSVPHPERLVVYARWSPSTLFQHGPALLKCHISNTMGRTWFGLLAHLTSTHWTFRFGGI
ncbi:hypothetical protein AVEN_197136-1 [Araneus ventricosus]|uniref:Uncharacterized protein n=1 Tax=Araneus ventricosus TaxID=182803 RepID=A0A4Y2A6A5_ARAVE|nr:hypothetical protein AVEN_197136-1 [Araneus ventricosus]